MKRGRLSIGEALDITVQIAGALVVAHRAGIIHRDIKPENIMVRADGYVKVLDFGLAKLTEQSDLARDARVGDEPDISSGLVMGTVKYMSPEQARGLLVDPRSDIFSLGVVLYEMLTGRAPFDGEAARDLIESILKDEPPPLSEYLPDAPEDLNRIVSNALRKDKTKRYQTAEELLVDLKNLRQQIESDSGPQTQVQKSDGRALSTEDQSLGRTSTIEYFVSHIREHKSIAAAGLIGLVILLGGVGYPLRKWIGRRALPPIELKTTMLTSTGGVTDAAISPDAKYVAYDTYDGGLFTLRLRELATNEDTQIVPPGERGFWELVFSPDGKYFYHEFWAEDVVNRSPLSPAALYRRPIFGGPAERIVDHLDGKITFSPDGKQLAFIRQDISAGLGTLVIANVDGTQERSIITRQAPDYFPTTFSQGPSWAPDGKHLVYVAVSASDGYPRIFELNLETNFEKPLTSKKWNSITDPIWLPDSSGILFIASNSAISNAIWRLSYPSGDLQRITNDTNKYRGLSITGDSNILVTTQWTTDQELWIAPDADASRARRIMPGRHDAYYGAAWTPDRRIVFTRETSENSDIWITSADGTNQRQLTSDVHQNVFPAVTSDGRYIVFQSNRTGADHIWRMDIDGSNQKQLTFGAVERGPDCSPDAKWIVYNAWETGKATIWKIPVEGGAPQQITDVQCFGPLVSHNGKLIACDSGERVLVFSFEGRLLATIKLPKGALPWVLRWTLDDRAIMYGKFADTVANFWIQPIDGNPPKQLTFFTPDQVAAPHSIGKQAQAWSPDGRDLLYARAETKSDVVMISGLK